MWLSEKVKRKAAASDACVGEVTIGGGKAAVFTFGELRDLTVCAPGGYAWRPAAGDSVVVLKGGTGGEEKCIVAAAQKGAPQNLAPGEVYIHSGGASIYLRNGRVDVTGTLYINGVEYKPCTCAAEVTNG